MNPVIRLSQAERYCLNRYPGDRIGILEGITLSMYHELGQLGFSRKQLLTIAETTCGTRNLKLLLDWLETMIEAPSVLPRVYSKLSLLVQAVGFDLVFHVLQKQKAQEELRFLFRVFVSPNEKTLFAQGNRIPVLDFLNHLGLNRAEVMDILSMREGVCMLDTLIALVYENVSFLRGQRSCLREIFFLSKLPMKLSHLQWLRKTLSDGKVRNEIAVNSSWLKKLCSTLISVTKAELNALNRFTDPLIGANILVSMFNNPFDQSGFRFSALGVASVSVPKEGSVVFRHVEGVGFKVFIPPQTQRPNQSSKKRVAPHSIFDKRSLGLHSQEPSGSKNEILCARKRVNTNRFETEREQVDESTRACLPHFESQEMQVEGLVESCLSAPSI